MVGRTGEHMHSSDPERHTTSAAIPALRPATAPSPCLPLSFRASPCRGWDEASVAAVPPLRGFLEMSAPSPLAPRPGSLKVPRSTHVLFPTSPIPLRCPLYRDHGPTRVLIGR